MRQDVVKDDKISLLIRGEQLCSESTLKKFRNRWNPFRDCNFRHVLCGLNSKNWYAMTFKILQQIAVVAANFNYEVLRSQTQALNHARRIFTRVAQPGFGIGRKVCVLTEELLRRLTLSDLDQETLTADPGMKRVKSFNLVQLICAQVAICQRHRS